MPTSKYNTMKQHTYKNEVKCLNLDIPFTSIQVEHEIAHSKSTTVQVDQLESLLITWIIKIGTQAPTFRFYENSYES